MLTRIKEKIKELFLLALRPRAIRFFRERRDKDHPLEEEVDLVFRWALTPFMVRSSLTIRPIQVRSELLRFLMKVERESPLRVCEIGTARGGLLYLLTRVSSSNAELLSIDLPRGSFGGGYPAWKKAVYRSFARNGQKIHLLREDSHREESFQKVREILWDQALDLLFIDGDHSYHGVKQDFEMYSPLVRKGGMIAFHDIVPGKPETVGGVPELWKELKGAYRTEEIIENPEQGGYGIGLLYFVD